MVGRSAAASTPSLAINEQTTKKKVDIPFTWEELAKHNQKHDCYVALRGKVYDVTDFIARHPGGEDTLLIAAGRDATQMFEMYHSFAVKEILPKFHVGTLITNELPVFPEPGSFHTELKTRVEEHFKKTGKDSKNKASVWIRYAVIYGALLGSYYAQFYVPFVLERTWLQVLCAITLGFFAAQIGLNPLHDASHFAITHNPMVWKILGATHDFFNGCSYLVWMYQHMVGHHTYTNIAGADPDVMTGEPDVRRIKRSQPWFAHYINQHIFVPILYGVLGLKVRFQDVIILYFVKKNDQIRINPVTTWHTVMFWGGKSFFVFYRLVLPLMAGVAFWKVITLFLVADTVASYWLALTFQVNHVVTEVEWPEPDEKGVVNMDWAKMQVATTQDYAHDSKFWTAATGALNYQAVHHIFPNVSQHHYPDILTYVKSLAKKHDVKYIIKDTFWDAFRTHVDHLYELGRKPIA